MAFLQRHFQDAVRQVKEYLVLREAQLQSAKAIWQLQQEVAVLERWGRQVWAGGAAVAALQGVKSERVEGLVAAVAERLQAFEADKLSQLTQLGEFACREAHRICLPLRPALEVPDDFPLITTNDSDEDEGDDDARQRRAYSGALLLVVEAAEWVAGDLHARELHAGDLHARLDGRLAVALEGEAGDFQRQSRADDVESRRIRLLVQQIGQIAA